jgi:hypothetical protein
MGGLFKSGFLQPSPATGRPSFLVFISLSIEGSVIASLRRLALIGPCPAIHTSVTNTPCLIGIASCFCPLGA